MGPSSHAGVGSWPTPSTQCSGDPLKPGGDFLVDLAKTRHSVVPGGHGQDRSARRLLQRLAFGAYVKLPIKARVGPHGDNGTDDSCTRSGWWSIPLGTTVTSTSRARLRITVRSSSLMAVQWSARRQAASSASRVSAMSSAVDWRVSRAAGHPADGWMVV